MPTIADLTPLRLALETFITAKQAQRCTARTIQHYRWTLDRFATWLHTQGITDPTAITIARLRAYVVKLDSDGLAAASVRDAARIVKTWLRFLHAEGLLAADPTVRFTLPQADEVLLPAFTRAEVKALLAAADLRNQAIILCLLDTGCRISEFCALTVGDVEIATGTVTIHQGKGRKDRLTYIGAKAKRALLKYLATRTTTASAALFVTATGERLTVDGVQSLLHRLGQRANVPHCHPHTFRRTFALWSLRAGMNIFVLQKLMGHRDLTILLKYLALVESDLQAGHAKAGAVDATL